ncbi:aryl-sulfate sulfotransferase [Desertivirga xinjiangensis]|uniref:aryl-sulfate sulfotransferase n=1 Tax=Desertivirga xinjiangensis TaxID=539206 RepID=UPI00210BF93A|nr:aryl-sulfate sulfotransferase [Pedobacter xinjiangensis]
MKKKKIWLILAGLLVCLLLLFRTSIEDRFIPLKVKNIELMKLPSNRLRFPVNINASTGCDAVIQYWKKGSKDTLYSTVSYGKQRHQLYITNTVARTSYRFRVMLKKGKEIACSKIYPLETQPIYQATPYFSLERSDPSVDEELKNKYFLTQILTQPGSVVIIDRTGEIVWYEAFQKGVKVSHWTKDRTVLCIVGPEKIPSSGGDEIVELAMDGGVLTHFKKGKGEMDKLVHHEVRKDKEGNIYSLTFTKKLADLSSVKGKKKDTLNGDGIVLFSKQGKKLWEWSVLDHLDPLKDPEILKHKKDWVHANSLYRLENGDFLMSFRDLNQVWKIDFKTGKVLWKLGEKGDFTLDPKLFFSAQHYAHPVLNKSLMILDNGDKTHISRAMIFNLDTQNMVANAERIVALPPEYYTTAKGSAGLFGVKKDKFLFCLTDPRAFLITDMKGKILWKVRVGGDPYRVEEISDFRNPKPVF